MRRDCRPGSEAMTDIDWLVTFFSERCYFYPGRDCPGWAPDGMCSRIEKQIPPESNSDG